MMMRSLQYRAARPIAAGIAAGFVILLMAIALLAAQNANAAPAAKLWPRWAAHDATSTVAIDHKVWNSFLGKYVRKGRDGINRVAYAAVTPADKAAHKTYLARMSKVRLGKYNRTEQFAYWINVYNAITVNLILERWPVKTIRQISISPGLFSRGPWGKKLFTVGGVKLSLDDIEHRILRPIWRDPRIHYAVNCASLGCPNLQAKAFTRANVYMLLDRGAYEYVNHPRAVQVMDGELRVSSLYRWFKEDFGSSDESVITHLRRYARPALRAQLKSVSGINDGGYDWAINSVQK
jgi:hypothetical protein